MEWCETPLLRTLASRLPGVMPGETPADAVERRRRAHAREPGATRSGAAWLRCCTELRAIVVEVLEGISLSAAAFAELHFTLVTMHVRGRFVTRGGPWVQIALPWAEVPSQRGSDSGKA